MTTRTSAEVTSANASGKIYTLSRRLGIFPAKTVYSTQTKTEHQSSLYSTKELISCLRCRITANLPSN